MEGPDFLGRFWVKTLSVELCLYGCHLRALLIPNVFETGDIGYECNHLYFRTYIVKKNIPSEAEMNANFGKM